MNNVKNMILNWIPSFVIKPLLIHRRYIDVNKLNLKLKSLSQELDEDRICDLKVLTNRGALLDRMPKNAVVAEVGVADGLFSAEILKRCEPNKLHLMDLWTEESENRCYNEQAYNKVMDRFSEEIVLGVVELNRALSWDALSACPDDYFDWVYIDACHTYDNVSRDLRVAMQKVKPGGFICRHDYTRWGDALDRMRVVEAVNQFCNEFKYDMVYLTHEMNRKNSFALRQSAGT
jgi:predicted O-methyltransferase YrrM